jgi:hypothetical protein
MFKREDFVIDSWTDFLSFSLILPFVGLVLPFLITAYVVGFLMDVIGWYDT